MELKCGECGSGDVYTTQDSVRVCRRCGNRKNLEVKENEKD
jgi:hypothetical protein